MRSCDENTLHLYITWLLSYWKLKYMSLGACMALFIAWSSLTNSRMVSVSWCKVILVIVLAYPLPRATADCDTEGQGCDKCYQTLANYLVNTSDNKYQLRSVFYPLATAAPVFVTVTYQYIDTNTTNINNTSIPWYWSAGFFYFLQPLEVFQYTSLYFGDLSSRSGNLTITLPAECASAPEEFMTELTEMVSTDVGMHTLQNTCIWRMYEPCP